MENIASSLLTSGRAIPQPSSYKSERLPFNSHRLRSWRGLSDVGILVPS